LILSCHIAAAQTQTSLRGQVTDQLGGAVAGATVTLVDSSNNEKTTTTNEQGIYVFSGIAAGTYFVRVLATGFALFQKETGAVDAGKRAVLDVKLTATIEKQKVTITSSDTPLSVDPEANQGAIILKGKDLDALPDDPDDLANALQAMAGASAGPNGGQLYIDGFSGGNMPPKEAIR